jgi:hypothetical protein
VPHTITREVEASILGHVRELIGDVDESHELVVLGDGGRDLFGQNKAGRVLALRDDGEPFAQVGPRHLPREQALSCAPRESVASGSQNARTGPIEKRYQVGQVLERGLGS